MPFKVTAGPGDKPVFRLGPSKEPSLRSKETTTISSDGGRLTQDEIARMIAEAEKFADEDREARERIEARNSLESYAFSLKNQLDDKAGLGGQLGGQLGGR
ncbi:HSP70-domain-containing protein [Thermothelomyces heterothallicus CBS 203.75]